MDIFETLANEKIIPVVVINDASKAIPLCEAMLACGINNIEITLRTDAALESIEKIANHCPDMLVSAGTVLTEKMADDAIDAGADFLIAPGFDRQVAYHCAKKGYTFVPSASSASDLCIAYKMDIRVVKFFPAEAIGGVKLLKALVGPFDKMRFIPTGGINEENIKKYLGITNVVACGGSWIVQESLVYNGDFDEIKARCTRVKKILEEV